MVQAARVGDLDVERGPDWLFVRPHGASLRGHEDGLAEQIWHLLEQSMAHRLVLEMDDVGPLVSSLIGQLALLHKRISGQGGLMRLCGLSAANQRVLMTCRLSGYFPPYSDRNDAVMASRPQQPR
jgi:anti-anti-sigma factor